jgi:hypothetical protein
MPTLSLRLIKKSRRVRYCDLCGKRIENENVIRLYGMAETFDKPYQVFLHRQCLTGKKEIAMLEAAEHRLQRTRHSLGVQISGLTADGDVLPPCR